MVYEEIEMDYVHVRDATHVRDAKLYQVFEMHVRDAG